MVSKTFVCLALLAVVAVCSCAPFSEEIYMVQEQKRSNVDRRNIASSNENQQPEEWTMTRKSQKQKDGKNLQVQDTSAGNSEEWVGKSAKVMISQEDSNNSKEIRQGPKHQPMHQGRNGPDYMRGQQVRENIQKSRKGNNDMSNENTSQDRQNQIFRNNQF